MERSQLPLTFNSKTPGFLSSMETQVVSIKPLAANSFEYSYRLGSKHVYVRSPFPKEVPKIYNPFLKSCAEKEKGVSAESYKF